jgi:hypothetical protein
MKRLALEARNEEIRRRYWELLPQLGGSTSVYKRLRKEYGLAQISLYQIVHHPGWYTKGVISFEAEGE